MEGYRVGMFGGQQAGVEGQRRSVTEEGVSDGPSLPQPPHPRDPPISRLLKLLLPPLPPVAVSVPVAGVLFEGRPQ